MEEIDLTVHEDITLFTDDEQVKVRVVNMELKQRSFLDGEKRDFMIFNGFQCYQKVKLRNLGKKKFRINLKYMNAIPKRQVKYAYNWFYLGLIMLILAGMFSYSLLATDLFDPVIAASLAIGSLLIGLPAIVYAYLKSSYRMTFYSHYGQAPVLEFIDGSPNNKSFITFIDVLQKKINSHNQPDDHNMRQYLLSELSELRRLKNESVISSSVFNNAMKRIINNPAYKL